MTRNPEPDFDDSHPITNFKSPISNHRIYTGSFGELEPQWMSTVADLQREDPLREINILVGSNILAS